MNWVGVANDYRSGNVETGWYSTLDSGQTWIARPSASTRAGPSGDPAVTFDGQGLAHDLHDVRRPGGRGPHEVLPLARRRPDLERGAIVGAVAGYDKPQVKADLSTSAHADDLLVAWDHFGIFGIDNVITSVSTDSGLTWSANKVINDVAQPPLRPMWPGARTARPYVLWADRGVNDVMFDRSFDGGLTLGHRHQDRRLHARTRHPAGHRSACSTSSPCTSTSRAAFSGNVYAAWHLDRRHEQPTAPTCSSPTSTDQGATWPAGVKVSTDAGQQNDILPRPRGRRAGQRQRVVLRPAQRSQRRPPVDVDVALLRQRGHVEGTSRSPTSGATTTRPSSPGPSSATTSTTMRSPTGALHLLVRRPRAPRTSSSIGSTRSSSPTCSPSRPPWAAW